jgi:hypothetical protein
VALYREWEDIDSESDGEGDGAVSDGKSNSNACPRLGFRDLVPESELKGWFEYAPWLVSNDIAAVDAGFRYVQI